MELCFSNKRFRGLFWAQCFGALNDNLFKNSLVILVLYQGWSFAGIKPELFAALAAGIFILPFLFISAKAGHLADSMDKSILVKRLKSLELMIAAVAVVGLLGHRVEILLIALFGFAVQSAFFGPVKYSILPQLLEPDELLGGNALVETATSMAILLGTMAGGLLAAKHPSWVAMAVVAIALAGWISARSVPSLEVASLPEKRSWVGANLEALRLTWKTEGMFWTVLGISWFWLFGSACLTMIPIYSKNVLGGTEAVTTLLLAAFSVGIGVGSLACEKLSRGRMELGWVPIGSVGMTVFAIDLAFRKPLFVKGQTAVGLLSQWEGLRLALDFVGLSVCAGLFIVPLYTFIQKRSEEETRSRLVAGNSLWNSAFIIVSTMILMLCLHKKVELSMVFLGLGVLNLAISFLAYRRLPEFVLRLYVVLICKMGYNLHVLGRSRIPEDGACLLVANHVTFVDWLFLASGTDRPVKFVMWHTYYNMPMVHHLFKDGGAIPIASRNGHPEIFTQAFESIHEALNDGQMVIIFPEGKLTTDGEVHEFRKGVEMILERDPVPVLPVGLKGLWETRFSKAPNRRWHWQPRIEMRVGEMIEPHDLDAPRLRNEVLKLLEKPLGEY